MTIKPQSHSQSGNILIYIIGAIFLLGLLIIIAKGSTTPGASIEPEKLLIRVSEVQQYGRELEQAIAYIMTNGHSEIDIRFSHPDAVSTYGDITNIPTRQIFSRDGGGATYRPAPSDIQTVASDWVFSGENRVMNVGESSGTNQDAEIIAFLPNVDEKFCLLINDKNVITNPAGAPPQNTGNVDITTPFTGTLQLSNTIWDSGTSYMAGKTEGCFEGSGTPPANTFHYYRVLLAR
jgi:hypothetical protein